MLRSQQILKIHWCPNSTAFELTLDGFTHIFSFDKVFTSDIRAHIVDLVNRSSTVQYYITTMKDTSSIITPLHAEAIIVDGQRLQTRVYMSGSGSQNTFYYYRCKVRVRVRGISRYV
ncbi:MAG: hypothetical protein AAFO96_29795 [Bacteroidota bacterium]